VSIFRSLPPTEGGGKGLEGGVARGRVERLRQASAALGLESRFLEQYELNWGGLFSKVLQKRNVSSTGMACPMAH
jgi:hypothetical protein